MKHKTATLVIKALRDNLGNAEDNLYRARSAFRNCTQEEMDKKYGQSEQTRRQIVEEYEAWVSEAKAALGDAMDSLGV